MRDGDDKDVVRKLLVRDLVRKTVGHDAPNGGRDVCGNAWPARPHVRRFGDDIEPPIYFGEKLVSKPRLLVVIPRGVEKELLLRFGMEPKSDHGAL